MTSPSDLLPELKAWNDGRGATALDYLFSVARSDVVTAYIDLFWPRFVEFESYIFREGFDEKHLRGWEATDDVSRSSIETAVNFLDVGGLFNNSAEPDSKLLDARIGLIRSTLAETYAAKLSRDFPDRRFEVTLINDADDYAISFHQV